jgi:hypothetical protein
LILYILAGCAIVFIMVISVILLVNTFMDKQPKPVYNYQSPLLDEAITLIDSGLYDPELLSSDRWKEAARDIVERYNNGE